MKRKHGTSAKTSEQPAQHKKAKNHLPKQRSGREIRAEVRKKGTKERRTSTQKLQPRDQARKRRRQMVSKSA
ncbi:hypothetical protein NDU88_008680 [Pleurodeles waltl]|uniref:Uncharacterized protein n=1 Tax=Pleurodeles waltl TaxID=8319 RepID=A0AAV7PSR7_PLEWA|nr:hypothetical protein NDU88_008680 [Pleurodeles waltl]